MDERREVPTLEKEQKVLLMVQNSTFLPTYNEPPPTAAEYLRQALPLMSANNIPTDPINYTIWYEYVSGKNVQLKQAVDEIISSGGQFDSNINQQLYKKYVCDDSIESIEHIRNNLLNLIGSTMDTVELTNKKATVAEESFSSKTENLESAVDVNDIKSILNDIILETRELASTSTLLKRKLHETNQEVNSLKNELEKARDSALKDGLTGLFNRRAFDIEMDKIFNNNPSESQISLLMFDLDNFKAVNDKFGHLVGDKVLKFTASLLEKYAAPEHMVARIGGEELAILMPDTSRQNALFIAEKIRDKLSRSKLQKKETNETLGKITVSVGISQLRTDDDINSFVDRADKALYRAKENGRNQVIDETLLG